MNSGSTVYYGVGAGGVIAGLISWMYTQSVLWTLLHVCGGWLYVLWSLADGKARW